MAANYMIVNIGTDTELYWDGSGWNSDQSKAKAFPTVMAALAEKLPAAITEVRAETRAEQNNADPGYDGPPEAIDAEEYDL